MLKFAPIMPVFCLLFLYSYYTNNFASKIDAYLNGMLTKHDKTRGHEENRILSSIYILLFQSTLDDIISNQLNAKHDNGTRFRQIEH